jgi:hypothetical protein
MAQKHVAADAAELMDDGEAPEDRPVPISTWPAMEAALAMMTWLPMRQSWATWQ